MILNKMISCKIIFHKMVLLMKFTSIGKIVAFEGFRIHKF